MVSRTASPTATQRPDRSQQRSLLVTGGSGFVGRAVVAELLNRGHRVTATATAGSEHLPPAPNLRWLRWDVTSDSLPGVDWSEVDVILHLAVPRLPFAFPEQAVPTFELAVAATFRLLEVARREGVGRVLAASTADVLRAHGRPACEDDVLYEPHSFYGSTKASLELLLRAYDAVLQIGVLRLFHPYGPGGDRFLVNRFVRFVAEGTEVRIEGRDGILVNPVWIDDLAHGVCLAVESNATGIFHFAGPETVTLRQLLETIGGLLNKPPRIRCDAGEGVQRHHATFARTTRLLGYHPRVGVSEGLRRLVTETG